MLHLEANWTFSYTIMDTLLIFPVASTQMFPEGVNNVFLKPREEADRLDEAYGKGKGIFENTESRDIAKNADKVQEMLAKYGAKEDATIVDLGAGTGLFLKDFAERVGPKGKVYACEISEAFAEIMRRKVEADETMASVIEVVVSPEDTLNLPSGSADLIFVCDVYHHLTYPVTIMRHCRRILKPDGHLVVVDFHRDDDKIWHKPKGWVYQHVRADQDTFRSEILSAGLELKEEPTIESLTENYIMVFTPAKATAPPSE